MSRNRNTVAEVHQRAVESVAATMRERAARVRHHGNGGTVAVPAAVLAELVEHTATVWAGPHALHQWPHTRRLIASLVGLNADAEEQQATVSAYHAAANAPPSESELAEMDPHRCAADWQEVGGL